MAGGDPRDHDLVADIGATHARFALTDPRRATPVLEQVRCLDDAGFAGLQQAAEHYLAWAGAAPRRAVVAVASPVDGDGIALTNRDWSFRRTDLQRGLKLARLDVINDLGAVAWALPHLGPADAEPLIGAALAPLRGPVSVLGPGTGLGVGLLVGQPGPWTVVETEGGHASFAPLDDQERAIAHWVAARHGRCSCERLLSGAGLSAIEAALSGLPPDVDPSRLRDPAVIVAAALAGDDALAERTLSRFCAVLGSVAGDIALVHGARGVAIAGGIVPRIIPFLRGSAFRERFLAKGRMSARLQHVPVQAITHPWPGLLGAAVALRRQGHRDASDA